MYKNNLTSINTPCTNNVKAFYNVIRSEIDFYIKFINFYNNNYKIVYIKLNS